MNSNWMRASLMAACLLISACQSTQPKAQLELECEFPRPEICTFEYRPVCGLHEDGEWRTHGNGCSACANQTVLGYKSGACEGQ